MNKQKKWVKRSKKSNLLPKKSNIVNLKNKRDHPMMSRKAKQLIFAICSSLCIGTIFGFITLQMSKQEDPHHATILNSSTGNEREEKSVKQIESFHVYVVQGGVFSEQENAKQWGGKYEKLDFPAVPWKRDKEFYLFTGVAETAEIANQYAQEMDEQGLDAYVKEWEVRAVNNDLSETDLNWLNSFLAQWQKSLQSIGNDRVIEEWIDFTEGAQGLSEPLQKFNDTITHHVQELKVNEANEYKEQQILLQLLQEYEQLTNE